MENIDRSHHDKEKTALLRNAAMAALIGGLVVGCSDRGEPLPDRHTPTSADYSLDTTPIYYDDIKTMERFIDDDAKRERLEMLQATAIAEWLSRDQATVTQMVELTLEKSTATYTIPMFVAYNIPGRDLNSYSSGGAETVSDYEQWIGSLSTTIDDRQAIVILEPDALPHTTTLDSEAADTRIDLLAGALDTLHRNQQTAVYLDAGNSGWIPVDTIADLIGRVDDASQYGVQGISLNVSNFVSEKETRQYADQVQTAFGKKLYVMIDNSRNGATDAVADGDWCNPAGQKLGTADPRFDSSAAVEVAFIKTPGQSDGECGVSTAPAGEFDGDLLIRQLG